MAKMVDASTLWKCETCFHHKNEGCSPEIWCENGEAYRPDCNKLVFVEAEPVKHGDWIMLSEDAFVCTCCHKASSTTYYFCPECGAQMDVSHEDNLMGGKRMVIGNGKTD